MAWTDVKRSNFNEKMLWMCMLRRYVFDYVLYKGSGRHKLKFQRAMKFIFTEDAVSEEGLNFEQICGLFGWEPDYLRRLTKELKRTDIKKLEAMKFKDDFDEVDAPAALLSLRWDSYQGSVPFFAPFNYSNSTREQLKLKLLERRQRLGSFVPMVRWDSATAAVGNG